MARGAIVSDPASSEAETRRIEAYYATRIERPMSPTVRFVLDERRMALFHMVERFVDRPLSSLRICDVGCGDGGDLQFWESQGVPAENLGGTELLIGPLAAARSGLPEADLRLVDGFELPFGDGAFDLVYASMVFSSILDPAARRTLFRELERVAAPGGIVAVYDFRVRKPTNTNVVAMTRGRIRDLGRIPNEMVPLTPLLPLLPIGLRMPGWLQRPFVRVLPRTHAVWIWQTNKG